ncbi:MAG: cytochrome P450 [Myxococcota bacterium]
MAFPAANDRRGDAAALPRTRGMHFAQPDGIAPGPRFAIPLGFTRAMSRDPLGWMLDCHRRYGDVVGAWLRPITGTVPVHPDYVEQVLVRNAGNYCKGAPLERLARPVMGRGLVVSDGEEWRRQRRRTNPGFKRPRLRAMSPCMTDLAQQVADDWLRRPPGESFDLLPEMSELALRIAARALLGVDLARAAPRFSESVTELLDFVGHRMTHPLSLPTSVPTRRHRRLRRALAVVDGVVYGLAAERRRSGPVGPDLLSLWIAGQQRGDGMTDAQLRDELVTILIAGHETTATTMAWGFALLSRHPEARRRLLDEIESAIGGRPPGIDDLPRIPFALQVVKEVLRLYPPAWAFGRQAIEEDEIGGYRVPAGSGVLLVPWVTHRHPDLWENAEGFDPDRFAPQKDSARPRYAWFPFAGGPRKCIGDEFALLEAQLVLIALTQRLEIDLVPGRLPTPQPLFTLRPVDGVWVTARPRRR